VWAIAGIPWCGETVTFPIEPPPAGFIATSWATSHIVNVPRTFRRCTARQPFALMASAGMKYWPPAFVQQEIEATMPVQNGADHLLGLGAIANVTRYR